MSTDVPQHHVARGSQLAAGAAPLTFTSENVTRWTSRTSGPAEAQWWGELDGIPVAYMKTLTYPDDNYCGARFVLCDVEVRDGHRNQGLARRLIEHAEATTGLVLHTSGNYTPLGAAALQGKIPVLPGHERDAGAWYRDMAFVDDWDNKIPRF